MGFIVEFFVEVVLGSLAEGYAMLVEDFFTKRPLSEKARKTLYVIAVSVGALLFILLFIGVVFLAQTQGESVLGWLLVALSAAYFVISIILKIRASAKK